MAFSFRLDIYINSGTRYKAQGTRCDSKGEDLILTKQFYFERDCISRVNIPEILRHSF
jgi:hypothetical protein